MSQSRIPSPARSQGAPITPRRYKSRTRSVGSPARSTTSVRLSALAQFKENNKDSFVLSPAPSRRSVLNDDTDIEEPRRRSWWRKLNDNSRDVMEVLNDNKVLETNEAVEEYIDIEVLSQEKKNYTLDLPDSSDSESISSIVIPQRKLFTQKDQAQNKFGQFIGTRETLAKLHKSTAADKTVNVPPKNLFGQGTRPKSKPIFPAALLNLSSNKTVNKTKENVAAEVKGQVRSLFGNRAGTKRKNMFADFIVSESEDEISEIQPKVFGFPKKPDTRRDSATSRGKREHSPTSSITTDIEMEEWKMLPSSTMVENQLEDMMAAAKTPVKRPRLSKLPDIKETETKSTVEQIEKEPSDEEQELKYDDEDDKSEANDEQQMQDQHEVDDNEHDSIQNNISAQQNKSHATSQNVSKVKDKNVNQSKIPSVNQQHNVSQHKMSPEKEQDVEMEVELSQKQDNNTIVKNKSYKDSNALQKDKAEESKTQKNDDVVNVDQVDNREEGNDQNKSKNNRNVSVKQNRDISQVKSNASQEKGNDKEAIAANASDNLDEDKQEELNENVDEEIQEENEDHIQNEMEEQESESKEPENDSEEQNEDVELQNQSEIIEQDEDDEVSMEQESETEQNKDEMDVQNDSHEQNHEDSETNAQNESAAQDHNESAPEIQSEQEEEAQDSDQEEPEDEEDNEVENESLAEDQDNEVENQSEIEEDDDRNASDAEMEQVSAVQDENDMADEDGNNESAEVQNEEDAEENESDDEQNDEEEVNESAEVNDSEEDQNESAEVNEMEDQNESAEVNEMEDQNESAEVNDTEEDQDESDQVNDTEEDQNESAEVQNDDEEDEQNESAEMDNDIDNDAQNESEQQENEDEIQDSNDQQQSDNEAPNETHDTTGRHRKKKDTNVNSPEAILHDKTNQLESFTAQGRNISVRKTTMLKNMTIRPSLAPPRESTGISDGTTNSSAEGSGWDSHRTTRKTLRQTFGRDFTPRKSLRALVMEKSAKRQTAITEVTAKFPQANSTELQLPEASMVPDDCEMTVEEDRQESNHDVSKRTRQTTLEMYLQKIKKQNMERNLKMQEAVRNSLKAPTTDVLNPFKVPARPMFSSRKPNKAASKSKAKQVKSALIPLDDLPPELLEDMKYKPPKRFQPSNASWITKRLYKFLESKLESKYDYKARVRAEKLVQTIYHFAKDLRRVPVAPAPAVDALKLEMARLGVVTTHFDFYQFFHEYMPREVRIKVVPDIVNKISVPRHGVFSDIIRGNTVQG